jgi:vacuolar-type H+-ATPase subunit I/STV1
MAQAAGKDLSPFDCLQDIRDGNIPMHLAVEKLGQVAFSLCNDISAASELYQSAKRTQDHFFDTSEDNMPDREKKQQQGDFMSRREMNYAKKVTKKISNHANKFEQSKEDKNIFEDEINELQKLAAANMARAEVAASMAHADMAARWADKLGMETMQEDAVHELVKNRKSNKDESEEQSESSEDSGDYKLPPVHIVFRPEVAKKSLIEEDDGDDDDLEENEFKFWRRCHTRCNQACCCI